ncbi:hypothetical protein GIB67_006692, partial [Kingdonia uniflora]
KNCNASLKHNERNKKLKLEEKRNAKLLVQLGRHEPLNNQKENKLELNPNKRKLNS